MARDTLLLWPLLIANKNKVVKLITISDSIKRIARICNAFETKQNIRFKRRHLNKTSKAV